MAMTVITISNAPLSLRGDLTKWMQEIATGVYIGNLNSRVREKLWERVTQSVGRGQATLSYATNNELGYQFVTHRTRQINISFDGIPLVMIAREESHLAEGLKPGFSNQAKYRQARKYSGKRKTAATEIENPSTPYIVLDIETDGLDPVQNSIIEMAALKVAFNRVEEFHCLISNEQELPEKIVNLTGITNQDLANEGRDVTEALMGFLNFVGDLPIVGYNLLFDIDFINEKLRSIKHPTVRNKKIDLMALVKKEKMFLRSYKLEDVLVAYGIEGSVSHRALCDARVTQVLATKVNEFARQLDRKHR